MLGLHACSDTYEFGQGRVMGYVGGGGNIAIATIIPPSSFVYCIVNIKYFTDFHILFISLARGFGFWMWTLTLARSVLFLMSAEYSAVMCEAWPGTLVT